jgi:hypothetical protein
MMNEILSSLDQVEGGFVRDFQTSGFSARVAELALFAYLHEQDLELDRSVPSPDFVVRGSRPVAIEATTTNPSDDKAPNEDFTLVPTDLSADDRAFVVQIDKALRKKLSKRDAAGRAYWEKPHVAGLPFVVAVSAFHGEHAQWQTAVQVSEYLYGVRTVVATGPTGKPQARQENVSTHEWNGRTIASGLFGLPDAAYLSGVLFSNSHTAAKFNRIGTEAGHGSSGVQIVRIGARFNPDPDAFEPLPFHYVVGERPEHEREMWSEGLHLFINPDAAVRLDPDALPGATSWILQDGIIMQRGLGDFHPIVSRSMVIASTDSRGDR